MINHPSPKVSYILPQLLPDSIKPDILFKEHFRLVKDETYLGTTV